MKSSQIRGAVLICPSSSEKSIIKIIKNMNNHNIVLATYSEKNIFQILTRYYFMRTILLVHKNHKF